MQRRSFLAATAASSAQVFGANERLRGAVIGAGGRGRFMTAQFKELGVEMAAVCDVYEPNLQLGLKEASSNARGYDNYRKMLEDKSIDVVLVTTPDHWH
ncbi:MAG: Gfo/Idh/MocA family oxidoreductase, partial [bacterium]|nr:Gfo/Idh/MocA family oxidoreductase [bacterium]